MKQKYLGEHMREIEINPSTGSYYNLEIYIGTGDEHMGLKSGSMSLGFTTEEAKDLHEKLGKYLETHVGDDDKI